MRPLAPQVPALSVVVAIVSDTTRRPDVAHLEPCLRALTRQANPPAMEIIVPYHPPVRGMARLEREYPEVEFLEIPHLRTYAALGSREHHDELRARGIAASRGAIVALVEDHAMPGRQWCAQVVESHRAPFAAIGGAIENAVDRPLNWAVYFCDFLRYQQPLRAGETVHASDANVSYKRAALEAVRPFWRAVFHERVVHAALRARGRKLALSPAMVVYQRRQGLRFGEALVERFVWGRSYAATRGRLAGFSRRLFWAAFSPALPLLLLSRMTAIALRKRRTAAAFVNALPITAALAASWSCGELAGYLTGRANANAGAAAADVLAQSMRAAS